MMCYVVSLTRALALALLSLSAISLQAETTARPEPGERPAVKAPARTLDSIAILTTNLEHKDRPKELKVVAERLRAGDVPSIPDFIICQEVLFKRSGPQKNTAEVLALHLGYYCRGTKRTSDREGVAIISRYPFEYYGERHLKAQTARLLLGFRRVSVMGEFQVPGIGRVRVVNVHFTNWEFEERIRRKQLEETLDWIAERDAEVPVAVTFLGGDFNAGVHEREMKALSTPKPGAPVFANFNGKTPTWGFTKSKATRIDLVFVAAQGQAWRLNQEQVLWKEGVPRSEDPEDRFGLSDHLPVYHLYSPTGPTFAGAEDDKAPLP